MRFMRFRLNVKLFLSITFVWLLVAIGFYWIFNFLSPENAKSIDFLVTVVIILSTLLFFCFTWLLYVYIEKLSTNMPHIDEFANLDITDKQLKDIKKFILSKAGITAKKYEFFYDIVKKIVNDANRYNKVLAMMIINIDYINPTYHKKYGATFEKMMDEVIEVTNNILRSGDVVAHVEKDKYIALLADIKQAKFAGPIAEKILKAVDDICKKYKSHLLIKASVGISIFPSDGETPIELHQKAQIAHYKAKQNHHWSYCYYKEDMNKIAREHIKLRSILQRAIKRHELTLQFQPQLSLLTNHIKRVEALVRLNDPIIGNITPAILIPLAEEIGLYTNIGSWVIREACRYCKQWQNKGYSPVSICVNISHKQFYSDELYQAIIDALAETKLDAKYLELEITETVIMNDINLAIDRLEKLHQLGVQIAIDDFGTGYTSINYLKKLPVNVLKIDKSFIHDIPYNKHDLAITNAMISLSHNLGIEVVAEGVEREEQLQYLKDVKCDLIQGFLVSTPVNDNELLNFLERQA